MKPKSAGSLYDEIYTPPYALAPILDAIRGKHVWESADGGLSAIKRELIWQGVEITATGLTTTGHDFFTTEPKGEVQVTNPPFSKKYKWLKRSYELGLPFALLMPVETMAAAKAQVLFEKYGVQIVFVRPRINFWTPKLGWHSRSQFQTAWFTWGLGLPETSWATLDQTYWPDWIRYCVPEKFRYTETKREVEV